MITIRNVDLESIPVARDLLLSYGKLRNFDIALGDYEKELHELPGEYSSPQGCLLIAFYNKEPVGIVALRKINDDICEMKRLFVKKEYRRKKIGITLIHTIIEKAYSIGYEIMRLDTHPWMKDAEMLYRSVGFEEISAYRFNPIKGVKFFELNIREYYSKTM
jgi:GNAT superfamily N-acetyltransferase